MRMKPSWIVFGVGVGLGFFLSMTPPVKRLGKRSFSEHREPTSLRNTDGEHRELEPASAPSGLPYMESAKHFR